MRTTKITILGTLATVAVMVAVSLPVRAEDPGATCDCWYRGWEDSHEYPLDQKPNALAFKLCLKEGKGGAYDDGFTKGKDKAERKCPFSGT